MKVAILGAGSVYTPDLVQAFLERYDSVGLQEWRLTDEDPERLERVGRFVQRMVEQRGSPFRVLCVPLRQEALQGADVVVVQVQTGGASALREDELLCRRWRLIHQEATGVGGMAVALRTVPELIDIALEMRACCPEAWLIHTANPVGMVTEALQKQVPEIRSLGLCSGPLGYQSLVAGELGLDDPFDVQLDYLGLNQLAWIRGARAGGMDVWKKTGGEEDPGRGENVMVRLGLVWDFFLNTGGRGEGGEHALSGGAPSGAERREARESARLSRYSDLSLCGLPPERPEGDGPLAALAAARLIEAVALDLGREQIVNTRHLGAVHGLPGEWVLELPCRVFRDRLEPLPAAPLRASAEGLLRVVKSFELLAVEAACTGDRSAALAALVAHPLGPDVEHAGEGLDEMLNTQQKFLPLFF